MRSSALNVTAAPSVTAMAEIGFAPPTLRLARVEKPELMAAPLSAMSMRSGSRSSLLRNSASASASETICPADSVSARLSEASIALSDDTCFSRLSISADSVCAVSETV